MLCVGGTEEVWGDVVECVGTVREGEFAHCDVCKNECRNEQDLRDHMGDVHGGLLVNVMYAGRNAELRGTLEIM